MSTDEKLTENVRVRVEPALKERLERAASKEKRSPSYVARRGIQREVDRLEAGPSKAA